MRGTRRRWCGSPGCVKIIDGQGRSPGLIARRTPRRSRAKPPFPFRRFNASAKVIRLMVPMYVRFHLFTTPGSFSDPAERA